MILLVLSLRLNKTILTIITNDYDETQGPIVQSHEREKKTEHI